MTPLQTIAVTVTTLAASTLFRTVAWYGHLKHLQASPGWWASLCRVGAVCFIFRS